MGIVRTFLSAGATPNSNLSRAEIASNQETAPRLYSLITSGYRSVIVYLPGFLYVRRLLTRSLCRVTVRRKIFSG